MEEQKHFNAEIVNLFPIPVCGLHIGAPTPQEMAFILGMEKRTNEGNKSSKMTNVLEQEELSSLEEKIRGCLGSYFELTFAPKAHTGIKITQSWCNYTDSDEFHHAHIHPNSVISGVYYPQAEKGVDQIVFIKNKSASSAFDAGPRSGNMWNILRYGFPVETGMLVLFPSHLEHEVWRVEHRYDLRISLSFNTFFTGPIGSRENLTELSF
jgi:uncharacterized protein (TIGR02466 family)